MADRDDVHDDTPDEAERLQLDLEIEKALAAKEADDLREYDRIANGRVATVMHDFYGVTEHTTASGLRVTLEMAPRINVPDENRDDLYDWLAEHGHHSTLDAIQKPVGTKQERRAIESRELKRLAEQILKQGGSLPSDELGFARAHKIRICPGPRVG